MDFDLKVSSELSEERSDQNSEGVLEDMEEQPHITTSIGCDLNKEDNVEGMKTGT